MTFNKYCIRRNFACLLALITATTAWADTKIDSVFYIQRNKNSNEVHYGVALDSKCNFDTKTPVFSYWKMLELGPKATERLRFWEHSAYGFKTSFVEADRLQIILKALPHQVVYAQAKKLASGDCTVQLTTKINQESAELQSAYVQAGVTRLIPDVDYVVLYGISSFGSPVSQTIYPD